MENNLEEEILQQYRRDFNLIRCVETPFINTLDEDELKLFQKQRNSGCSKKGILICAIIFLILNCGGIYFAISRNEGYKALKLALENNIKSIDQNFPDKSDSLKLFDVLNNLETYLCSYQEYHDNKCSYSQYKEYCNKTLYSQGKCSYMDALIYNGSATLNYCSKENYKAGYCTKLQQDDYEKFLYYKKIIDGIPNKLAYIIEQIRIPFLLQPEFLCF